MSARAPLALTMGEPAGIGPEIAAKAWQRREQAALPPFFVIGAAAAFAGHGLDVPIETIEAPEHAGAVFARALPLLAVEMAGEVRPGRPDGAAAPAVIAAIDRAVALAMAGRAGGVVTNPIHKRTLYEAGFDAAGHTDYLARLAGRTPDEAVMMLAVPGLRVVPVTVHVPLAEVAQRLSTEAIVKTARIVAQALEERFGLARPRLALAGLNPHAGEGGAIGREDVDIVAPAIDRLQAEGIDARGPFAADTLFHAEARKRYDAAICMYHDQALIPIKTLDFDHGVNLTLGLPFLRTSPDHGTALDIAGTGRARPDSLIAAVALAGALTQGSPGAPAAADG